MTDSSLEGVCVLVTRPEALGGPLAQLVADAGGEAIRQPAVEIIPADDIDAIGERLADDGPFDIAVFVSVNAVTFGLDAVPDDEEEDGMPLLAAIGPATRRALENARRCDISPATGYTSEALLAEPELQDVEGMRIVIVRGTGGRELLFEELDQRGALVHIAEVYERRAPESMPDDVLQKLADGKIDLITATSVEILNNIVASVDGEVAEALLDCQLVTASSRVVQRAGELGFRHPALLAGAPDDGALLASMQAWQQQRLQNAPASVVEPESTQAQPESTMQQEPSMTKQEAAGEPQGDSPAPVPAPAEPAPAEGSGGGKALALLALVVALLAGAGTAYTWSQQKNLASGLDAANAAALADAQAAVNEAQSVADKLMADLAAADRQTEDATADIEAKVATDIAGIEASSAQLRAAQQRLTSGIEDNSNAIDRMSGRIQSTEAAIDTLRGVSATVRQSWILAQAEYFMVTANDALQLSGNPDVALAALQNADARLQELGDPGLSQTRAVLAQEISALRAMPKPDIEGIVHELGGLAARVDQFEVANELPSRYGSDTEREAEGESAWERAKSVVSAAVRDTVNVRKATAEDKPLLAPEEVFFLRRNIELQLEVARLSALRAEPAVYAESLRSARRWLTNWFDPEDSAVGSAVEALTRLESQDIKPALPDISASLRALRSAPVQRGDSG
ncbi:MAG: uroporphyrinogen-III C-methyltransferase [Pseudomonadota bacterium]